MRDIYSELVNHQKKLYGDFETMDKEKAAKTRLKVKKDMKNAEVDDFWDWFIGPAARKNQYLESAERNKKSLAMNKEFSTSFSPRLCQTCNQVWDRPIPGRNMKLEYYQDFPTYGMKREDCPPCYRKNRRKNAKQTNRSI